MLFRSANYLYWKAQVLPAVRGAEAMGLLDGTDPAPAKMKEAQDSEKNTISIPNPAYGVWIARDQQLVSYLVKSISPELLGEILGLVHAAEIWAAITNKFAAQVTVRLGSLTAALISTKKRDLSADAYITKKKGFISELASAGRTIPDTEFKEYLLAGLSGEYNGLVAAINANPASTSADVCNQLLAYDHRQAMLNETEEITAPFSSSANAARRGGGGGGYHSGHAGGGGYRPHQGGGCGGHGGGGGGHHHQHHQGRPPRHDTGRRPQAKGGHNRGRGNRVPSQIGRASCRERVSSPV